MGMKDGIFTTLRMFTLAIGLLAFQGCATFWELSGETYEEELDRGYRVAADEETDECSGRFCHTETESRSLASDDGEYDGEGRRVRTAIEARDVILGMTRQQVMESWGEPQQREVAGSGGAGHERWTYGTRYSLGSSRVVIFENGKVAGWHR
jgi:hypothetical protein